MKKILVVIMLLMIVCLPAYAAQRITLQDGDPAVYASHKFVDGAQGACNPEIKFFPPEA